MTVIHSLIIIWAVLFYPMYIHLKLLIPFSQLSPISSHYTGQPLQSLTKLQKTSDAVLIKLFPKNCLLSNRVDNLNTWWEILTWATMRLSLDFMATYILWIQWATSATYLPLHQLLGHRYVFIINSGPESWMEATMSVTNILFNLICPVLPGFYPVYIYLLLKTCNNFLRRYYCTDPPW